MIIREVFFWWNSIDIEQLKQRLILKDNDIFNMNVYSCEELNSTYGT